MKCFAERQGHRSIAIPAQFDDGGFERGETQGQRDSRLRAARMDDHVGLATGRIG